MPTTISQGANRITTYGLFQHKHQCINALKTARRTVPLVCAEILNIAHSSKSPPPKSPTPHRHYGLFRSIKDNLSSINVLETAILIKKETKKLTFIKTAHRMKVIDIVIRKG